MTTFEALVSCSQLLLRARGEWHAGATAYGDIQQIVNDVANMLRYEHDDERERLERLAIVELKRRATPSFPWNK